ncbi:hypothetical protein D3C78_1155950 [compost metagenome]
MHQTAKSFRFDHRQLSLLEGPDVHSGGKHLRQAGQHDHPNGIILFGPLQIALDQLRHRQIDGVLFFRPVQGNHGNAVILLIPHREGQITHWFFPPGRTTASAAGR